MRARGVVRGLFVFTLCMPVACGNKGDSAGAASASAAASAGAPPAVEPSASVSKSAEPATSAAPSASADAGKPEKPRVVRRRGTVGEIFTLARVLELKDEQKAKLDAIDDELWGAPKEDDDEKNALKEFWSALEDGVKAGRVDRAKLTPHYAVLDEAAARRRKAEADALNQLHEMLDEAQRKKLTEILRHRHPGAKPAKPVNAKKPVKPVKPPKPAKPPAKSAAQIAKEQAAERAKRRSARVTALLGLDPIQQKRVAPILARYDTATANRAHHLEMEKRMQALIKAFEKDEFDAEKLDLGKGPRARMDSRVAFISTLMAVLKPDQRARLAHTIERPSARRWGGAVVGEPGPPDDD
jgi:hypothetical protein